MFGKHLKLDQMVLVANDILDLVDVDEVYFAEGVSPKISFQTDLVLTVEVRLHVVQLPGNEFIRQALIFAASNLIQECVMKQVLIVDCVPHVVLLGLHHSQYFKRIDVSVGLEGNQLCPRVVAQVDDRRVVRMLDRVEM